MAEFEWYLSQLKSTTLKLLTDSHMLERRIMLARHDERPEAEIAGIWDRGVRELKAPFADLCEEYRAIVRFADELKEEAARE